MKIIQVSRTILRAFLFLCVAIAFPARESRASTTALLCVAPSMGMQWSPLAVITWDHGAGDDLWTTGVNWVGDVEPVAGDDIVFDGSVTQGNCTVNNAGNGVFTSLITINNYVGTITHRSILTFTGPVGISLNSGRLTAGMGPYPKLTLAGNLFVGSDATLDFGSQYWNDFVFNKAGTQTIGGLGKITLEVMYGVTIATGAVLSLANNSRLVLHNSSLIVNGGLMGGVDSTLQMHITSSPITRIFMIPSGSGVTLWVFEAVATGAATAARIHLIAPSGLTVLHEVHISGSTNYPELLLQPSSFLTLSTMSFNAGYFTGQNATVVYNPAVAGTLVKGTPDSTGVNFGTVILDSAGTLEAGIRFTITDLTINAGTFNIGVNQSLEMVQPNPIIHNSGAITGASGSKIQFISVNTAEDTFVINNVSNAISVDDLNVIRSQTGGFSLSITLIGGMNINRGLHMTGSSTSPVNLYLGSSNLTLGGSGDVLFTGGVVGDETVFSETSSIYYTSSSDAKVYGMVYHSLIIDGNGGFSPPPGLTVLGTFEIRNGGFGRPIGALLELRGNVSVAAGSEISLLGSAPEGILRLTSNASQSVTGSGTINVARLEVLGTGGTTTISIPNVFVTLTSGVTIESGKTLALGTTTLHAGTGAWTVNGTFDPGTSEIRFLHPSATIFVVPPTLTNFYDLAFSDEGSGATFSLSAANTIVERDLIFKEMGTLALGSIDLLVGRHLTLYASVSAHDGSVITMTGMGANIAVLSGSGPTFASLLITGAGSAVNFQTNATISQTLQVLGSGQVDFGTRTITINRVLDLAGASDATTQDANFIFSGNSSGDVPGPRTYRDVTIQNGNYQMANNVACRDLVLSTGTLMGWSTATLTLTGALTVPFGSHLALTGSAIMSGSNVTLEVSGLMTVDDAAIFSGTGMTIRVPGTVTIQDLIVSGAVSLTGEKVSVGGSLVVSGTLEAGAGSRLTLSGAGQTLTSTGLIQLDDLVLSGASGASFISGTLAVKGSIFVGSGETLLLQTGSVLTLSGSDPLQGDGLVAPQSGTVVYSNSTGATLRALGYGSLIIDGGSSSTFTITGASNVSVTQGLGIFSGTLSVGSNSIQIVGPVTVSAQGGFSQVSPASVVLTGQGTIHTDGQFGAGLLVVGGNFTLSGSNEINVADVLIVDPPAVLDLGSGTVRLEGGGRPLQINGTMNPGTGSKIIYSSSIGATLTATTYPQLEIDGSGGLFVPEGTMTVLESFTLTAGDFALQNHTLIVGGDMGVRSSFTTSPQSLIQLTGSSRVLNTANGGFLTVENMAVDGTYILTGILTLAGSGAPLVVDGGFSPDGDSTVVYNSSVGATLAPIVYHDLKVDRVLQTFVVDGSLSAFSIIVGNSTTLELGSSRVSLTGTSTVVLDSLGTVSAGTASTLVVSGSNVDIGGIQGSITFGNLIIDGTVSPIAPAGGSINILGNLEVLPGRQFTIGQVNINIGGDLANNGIITVSTPTPTMTLSGGTDGNPKILGLTLGTTTLGNVVIIGNYVLGGDVTVQDRTIASGGVLDKATFTMTIGGIATNQNTFFIVSQHANNETANVPFFVTLVAKDTNENTIADYTGGHQITFTSSSTSTSASITLPDSGSFTFSNGVLAITMTITSDTVVTLLVTDDAGMGGSVSITIEPGQQITSDTGGTVTASDGTKVDIPQGGAPGHGTGNHDHFGRHLYDDREGYAHGQGWWV